MFLLLSGGARCAAHRRPVQPDTAPPAAVSGGSREAARPAAPPSPGATRAERVRDWVRADIRRRYDASNAPA